MTPLSKSLYKNGLQCPKLLWYAVHDRDKLAPTDAEGQARIDAGHQLGQLARDLFPGGREIPFERSNRRQRVRMTAELIAAGASVIYEASFEYRQFIVMVDILKKDADGRWKIYEVKSKTSDSAEKIPDHLIEDVAIQYYILEQCGIPLSGCYLVYPDKTYYRQAELELEKFFTITDLSEAAAALQPRINERLQGMQELLQQTHPPDIAIGLQCHQPEECPARGACWAHIPDYSLFDINSISKKTVFEKYYPALVRQADIPDLETFCLDSKGQKIKQSMLTELQCNTRQTNYSDPAALREWLAGLTYPLYYLDFESFSLAIPPYPGTKAYSQICFQYSIHIEYADGQLEHREYLAESGSDPRRDLSENLLQDIPVGATVIVYYQAFEASRIREMAALYPDLAAGLLGLLDNMKDLCEPFKKRMLYHWRQKGSNSIKDVLPAWVPDMLHAYTRLDRVHQGGEASQAYLDLAGISEQTERMAVIRALLAYCGMDTLAMVRLLEVVRREAGDTEEVRQPAI